MSTEATNGKEEQEEEEDFVNGEGDGDEDDEEEEDLEKLEAEIARMEAEAARLKESEEHGGGGKTSSADGSKESGTAKLSGDKTSAAQDAKSIYVGQVDYSATPEELVSHFDACGTIERVTIMCDKFTGQPKGFAYLEFQKEESVENAIKLDGSEFKGRQLKVTKKRVNQPGMAPRGRGAGRGGRGFSGRGGGRGGGPPGRGGAYRGGFRGRGRSGFRGGGRGGGGGGYHPYY